MVPQKHKHGHQNIGFSNTNGRKKHLGRASFRYFFDPKTTGDTLFEKQPVTLRSTKSGNIDSLLYRLYVAPQVVFQYFRNIELNLKGE